MNSETHLLFIVSLLRTEQGYTRITRRTKKKYRYIYRRSLPPPPAWSNPTTISSITAFPVTCSFCKHYRTLTEGVIGLYAQSQSNSTLFWHKKFNLLSNCHKHHCVTALGDASALASESRKSQSHLIWFLERFTRISV